MKWEYKKILSSPWDLDRGSLSDEALAKLGAEGWELVCESYLWLLFKRPVESALGMRWLIQWADMGYLDAENNCWCWGPKVTEATVFEGESGLAEAVSLVESLHRQGKIASLYRLTRQRAAELGFEGPGGT